MDLVRGVGLSSTGRVADKILEGLGAASKTTNPEFEAAHARFNEHVAAVENLKVNLTAYMKALSTMTTLGRTVANNFLTLTPASPLAAVATANNGGHGLIVNRLEMQLLPTWSNYVKGAINHWLATMDPVTSMIADVNEMRVNFDHYQRKLEGLNEAATAKKGTVSSKTREKLLRNAEKLEQAQLVYERAMENTRAVMHGLVVEGWKDLAPIMLKVMQFESAFHGEVMRNLTSMAPELGRLGDIIRKTQSDSNTLHIELRADQRSKKDKNADRPTWTINEQKDALLRHFSHHLQTPGRAGGAGPQPAKQEDALPPGSLKCRQCHVVLTMDEMDEHECDEAALAAAATAPPPARSAPAAPTAAAAAPATARPAPSIPSRPGHPAATPAAAPPAAAAAAAGGDDDESSDDSELQQHMKRVTDWIGNVESPTAAAAAAPTAAAPGVDPARPAPVPPVSPARAPARPAPTAPVAPTPPPAPTTAPAAPSAAVAAPAANFDAFNSDPFGMESFASGGGGGFDDAFGDPFAMAISQPPPARPAGSDGDDPFAGLGY